MSENSQVVGYLPPVAAPVEAGRDLDTESVSTIHENAGPSPVALCDLSQDVPAESDVDTLRVARATHESSPDGLPVSIIDIIQRWKIQNPSELVDQAGVGVPLGLSALDERNSRLEQVGKIPVGTQTLPALIESQIQQINALIFEEIASLHHAIADLREIHNFVKPHIHPATDLSLQLFNSIDDIAREIDENIINIATITDLFEAPIKVLTQTRRHRPPGTRDSTLPQTGAPCQQGMAVSSSHDDT